MNIHKRIEGSAHLLLMAVVVLAVIGAAGYWVWENRDADERTTATLEEPATPCEGKYYESHAHPDDDAIVEKLPEITTKYNVGCSVLFTQMDINDIDNSLLDARERYGGMPGRIAVFYDVIKDSPAEVTRAKLDELWQKSEGKFKGFGEFAFYEKSFQGTQLTDTGWPVIFEFAAEKDLVIMIHPQKEMVASLETMLQQYPNTKVLVHGFELPDQMGGLLKKYKNLYYTLDTATMVTYSDGGLPQVMLYPGGGPGSEFDVNAFVAEFDSRKTQLVSDTVEKWLPVLLAAPDKVMWGTDISMKGHVDDRVYSRLMDLTKAFLEKVPEQHREKYLRDNAFKLFGEGAKLTPLSDEELDQLDTGDEDDGDKDDGPIED